MSVNEKMTAIADAIRVKTGGVDALTLDGMAAAIAGIEAGSGGDYTNEQITALIDGTHTEFAVPDGCTRIRKGFFQAPTGTYDYTLKKVTLPDTIKVIGANAFSYCSGITELNLPDGITDIGASAFLGCGAWALQKLPEELIIIGNSAFHGCQAMTINEIPVGVTTIGNEAFRSAGGVSVLTFRGTPTSISSSAFNKSSIKTINVPWAEGEVANAPWGATNATINYNYTGE